jgi:hypothetical protein
VLRASCAERLDGTGSLSVRKPTVFGRKKVIVEIREETAFSVKRFLVRAVIMRSGVKVCTYPLLKRYHNVLENGRSSESLNY